MEQHVKIVRRWYVRTAHRSQRRSVKHGCVTSIFMHQMEHRNDNIRESPTAVLAHLDNGTVVLQHV